MKKNKKLWNEIPREMIKEYHGNHFTVYHNGKDTIGWKGEYKGQYLESKIRVTAKDIYFSFIIIIENEKTTTN